MPSQFWSDTTSSKMQERFRVLPKGLGKQAGSIGTIQVDAAITNIPEIENLRAPKGRATHIPKVARGRRPR